jgi:hypothetical protein
MDRNQVLFPAQQFNNSADDHVAGNSGRDGLLGNNYGEFVPTDTMDKVKQLAKVMADEILISAGSNAIARQRSTYRTGQSLDFAGTTNTTFVGGEDDWAFSRQFTPSSFGEVFAFTIEAGKGVTQANPSDENDGGFFPNDEQFLKVEQEIHAALFGLLTKGGR